MKDFVRIACVFCHEPFTRNKMSRRLFCSGACEEARRRERKGSTQSAGSLPGTSVNTGAAILVIVSRTLMEIAELVAKARQ